MTEPKQKTIGAVPRQSWQTHHSLGLDFDLTHPLLKNPTTVIDWNRNALGLDLVTINKKSAKGLLIAYMSETETDNRGLLKKLLTSKEREDIQNDKLTTLEIINSLPDKERISRIKKYFNNPDIDSSDKIPFLQKHLKGFFRKHLLPPNIYDESINPDEYLMHALHQGGLFNPTGKLVAATLRDHRLAIPKGQSKSRLAFETTKNGFTLQETRTIDVLADEENTDNQTEYSKDNPVLEIQATIDVDFSKTHTEKVPVESTKKRVGLTAPRISVISRSVTCDNSRLPKLPKEDDVKQNQSLTEKIILFVDNIKHLFDKLQEIFKTATPPTDKLKQPENKGPFSPTLPTYRF